MFYYYLNQKYILSRDEYCSAEHEYTTCIMVTRPKKIGVQYNIIYYLLLYPSIYITIYFFLKQIIFTIFTKNISAPTGKCRLTLWTGK